MKHKNVISFMKPWFGLSLQLILNELTKTLPVDLEGDVMKVGQDLCNLLFT